MKSRRNLSCSNVGSRESFKITANIFISFIGAGVLGLPFAFKESGILEGIIIMTVVSVFSIKAMLLLIDCKYKVLGETIEGMQSFNGKISKEKVTLIGDDNQQQKKTFETDLNYGDIGFEAMGSFGCWVVDATVLVAQIGFCCAYLIFISENLSSYINYFSKKKLVLLLLPILFFLCLLRKLHKLAIFSFMAQISNIFAFGVVLWFDFKHINAVQKRFHPKEFSWQGFPFFFALAMYCYEGAGMILSLEASLAEEIRGNFKRYFVKTLVCITTVYILFGISGYMSFGVSTNEIITLNLPRGEGIDFSKIVTVCLCISLYFCYPVMMFPVSDLLESRFLSSGSSAQGTLLRLMLVSLTGLIVLAVPNFSNLMALVGATCCTFLSFILPGLFHLIIMKGSLTRRQLLLDYFLVIFGAIGCVVGTADAVLRITNTHTSEVSVSNMTLVSVEGRQMWEASFNNVSVS